MNLPTTRILIDLPTFCADCTLNNTPPTVFSYLTANGLNPDDVSVYTSIVGGIVLLQPSDTLKHNDTILIYQGSNDPITEHRPA